MFWGFAHGGLTFPSFLPVSLYISQITVDVETSFSDAIFAGLLVARFCPFLSLLICAGHLSEIMRFLLLNKSCKDRDHGLFMSILLLTAS